MRLGTPGGEGTLQSKIVQRPGIWELEPKVLRMCIRALAPPWPVLICKYWEEAVKVPGMQMSSLKSQTTCLAQHCLAKPSSAKLSAFLIQATTAFFVPSSSSLLFLSSLPFISPSVQYTNR